MGSFCGSGGGGSGGGFQNARGPRTTRSQTSTNTSLNPLQEGFLKFAMGSASDINSRPFQPYNPANRFAPLPQQHYEAMDMMYNSLQPASRYGSNYTSNSPFNLMGSYGTAPASMVTGGNAMTRPIERGVQSVGSAGAGRVDLGNALTRRMGNTVQRVGNAGPNTVDIAHTMSRDLPSTDTYMNPYTQAVLDPALRELRETAIQQRQGIGNNAAMSGAYGDARHGIVEANQMGEEQLARGQLTAEGYQSAWENAMQQKMFDVGQLTRGREFNAGAREQALARRAAAQQQLYGMRTGDLERKLQAQTTNQALREQMLARRGNAMQQLYGMRTGDIDRSVAVQQTNAALREQQLARRAEAARGLSGLETARLGQSVTGMNMALGMGDRATQYRQQFLDQAYENYLRQYEHPFRGFDAISAVLSGMPVSQNVQQRTQTIAPTIQQPQQTNPLWSLLGSLGGSAIGGFI